MSEAHEGQRITTRYFGGYESVRVLQAHDTYYIVSRFGGATTDVLPKDRVSKIFDENKNVVWCSDEEKTGIHPALAGAFAKLNQDHQP